MGNTLIAQLNNPAMLQQLSRKSATVVSLLLIIACAYLLVQITWMFLPQDDAAMAPMKTMTKPLSCIVIGLVLWLTIGQGIAAPDGENTPPAGPAALAVTIDPAASDDKGVTPKNSLLADRRPEHYL